MSVLVAREVVFYAQGDETAFFAWLEGIACVGEVRGVGRELQIEIDDEKVADNELRELIAIFHRYMIDSKQLAMFATKKNAKWFRNKKSFWYSGVFA